VLGNNEVQSLHPGQKKHVNNNLESPTPPAAMTTGTQRGGLGKKLLANGVIWAVAWGISLVRRTKYRGRRL